MNEYKGVSDVSFWKKKSTPLRGVCDGRLATPQGMLKSSHGSDVSVQQSISVEGFKAERPLLLGLPRSKYCNTKWFWWLSKRVICLWLYPHFGSLLALALSKLQAHTLIPANNDFVKLRTQASAHVQYIDVYTLYIITRDLRSRSPVPKSERSIGFNRFGRFQCICIMYYYVIRLHKDLKR